MLSRYQIKSNYKHSLVLQFVLSELITIQRLTNHMENLLTENTHANLISFTYCMGSLIGSSQAHVRLFSWTQDGHLAKLKNYCTLLRHTTPSPHPESDVAAHDTANEAWIQAIQIVDLLQGTSTSQIRSAYFAKLRRFIQHLAKLLLNLIQPYHDDENFMFFLLRNHAALNLLYKPEFVLSVVQKAFPKGILQFRHFLVQRYTERGFAHLVPVIDERLSELN